MVNVQRTQLSSDRHLVQVAGRLSSAWVGRFAARLTERGFNIEKASAVRNARGFWTAGFELARMPGAPDLAEVDFTILVTAPGTPPLPPTPARLYGYTLSRPAGHAWLVLEVEAPDQIGFLAQLLHRLAFFSLFPTEMKIETAQGIVRDTVHLSSVGGSLPSGDAVEALRRDLDSALVEASALTGS